MELGFDRSDGCFCEKSPGNGGFFVWDFALVFERIAGVPGV